MLDTQVALDKCFFNPSSLVALLMPLSACRLLLSSSQQSMNAVPWCADALRAGGCDLRSGRLAGRSLPGAVLQDTGQAAAVRTGGARRSPARLHREYLSNECQTECYSVSNTASSRHQKWTALQASCWISGL